MAAQNTDWPYLKKYEKDNSTLPTPAPNENRIVFMGDSITEFWSKEEPDFFSKKEYINRGISGQTSPQMLLRFRADVIQLHPKAVVILAGGNDIAGNTGESSLVMIMNNLISMVELAQVNHIKVILCSLLPANHFYWNPKIKPANCIITLNKMIKDYAFANKILFVDYYSALVDKHQGLSSQFSKDGVHPDRNGYTTMKPVIDKAIVALLEDKE